MRLHPVLAVFLACLLSSCANFIADQKANQALIGTSWTLYSIQASSTRLADPGKFTIKFEAEGKATLRLDCNRGSAKWQASAESPSSGLLMIGPAASTRAMCAQSSLDDQVSMGLTLVRGYTLSEGKLLMNLMSDGTIMEWHAYKE